MTYGAWGLMRSRTGRAFIAVRDNENAAEVIGVNVFYYKTLAFFIGAFYAGIAGALWAYYVRYVQADQFTLWLSVWYIGHADRRRMGSILGAIVGTVVIRLMQEVITVVGPMVADVLPALGGPVRVRRDEHAAGRADHRLRDLRAARAGPPVEHRQGELPHLAVPALMRGTGQPMGTRQSRMGDAP